MSALRLTVRVNDSRGGGGPVVRSFFRSPVTVGRGARNALQLPSKKVSAYHGAFAFDRTSLRYVDCGSSNGTRIDDVPVVAEIPVDVRETSVIRIGPFQVTVHMHEIFSLDALQPSEETGIARVPSVDDGPAQLKAILATHPNSDALRWLFRQWTPAQLLARALSVFDVLAQVVVELRPDILAAKRCPIRGATRAEDVMAYMLDPSLDGESLEELLTYLVDVAHPSLGATREGNS